MNNLPYCVIGSGPSSVAAAVALLNQNQKIVMVDVGTDLDAEKTSILNNIYHDSSLALNSDLLKKLYSFNLYEANQSSYVKSTYGSTYCYETNNFFDSNSSSLSISSSLSKGGLSCVWGATVLPYNSLDIADWPITFDSLRAHNDAIANILPIACYQDPITSPFYPPIKTTSNFLNFSPSIKNLLIHLNSNKHILNSNGISFQNSLLALSNFDSNDKDCIYCGNCMRGCQKQLIYNSKFTLANLLRNENFSYISNTKLIKFNESNNVVSLKCRNVITNNIHTIDCKRLYIGCGVINSAKILIESYGLNDKELSIKDSQYFYFPILQKKYIGNDITSLNALCQLFMKISLFHSNKYSHLQLYPMNITFESIIRNFPYINYFPKKFLRLLLSNFFLIQAYLPSEFSSIVKIKFNTNLNTFSIVSNPLTSQAIDFVVDKISENSKYMGIFPALKRKIITGLPCSGHHFGSTFPMSNQPTGLNSDIYGRILGSKRVHCIDASIFPNIPPGPITFNIMANAHRIASHFKD